MLTLLGVGMSGEDGESSGRPGRLDQMFTSWTLQAKLYPGRSVRVHHIPDMGVVHMNL